MSISESFSKGPDQFKAPEEKKPREKADDLVKSLKSTIQNLSDEAVSNDVFLKKLGEAQELYNTQLEELLAGNPELLEEYQKKIKDLTKARINAILENNPI